MCCIRQWKPVSGKSLIRMYKQCRGMESKMQIRHLRNSKIITEILILCVAYISMAAGVYIGIAGNDTSKAYYSLIVIIPAIVTYFSRKYIKSYPLFMVINLVFVVIAALLADTDLEFAGYVICAAAISGHSIRLKNLYVNRSNMSEFRKIYMMKLVRARMIC